MKTAQVDTAVAGVFCRMGLDASNSDASKRLEARLGTDAQEDLNLLSERRFCPHEDILMTSLQSIGHKRTGTRRSSFDKRVLQTKDGPRVERKEI